MSQSVTPATLDARQFRDTLGHYAAGITIVSGHEGGEPIGFTCQSFYSVSIEPPLVSFSVMKDSTTYPRIAADGKLSIRSSEGH
jgi:3-hydroxy-9,10-secoandrosta-1,3,5(10)-triene-9,17-dione monooxygenase reductase component